MKISHIALWTIDLERSKTFYCSWFGAIAGPKYTNPQTGFASYFLEFEKDSCRLEIMSKSGLAVGNKNMITGLTHFAVSVGNKDNVDTITKELKEYGIRIISEPRTTGDGYYESVIEDPDGNWVEITA